MDGDFSRRFDYIAKAKLFCASSTIFSEREKCFCAYMGFMSNQKNMTKVSFNQIKNAFSDRECQDNINLIRQLLYDFNYTNLASNNKYCQNEIVNIRKGILNFIYSGQFNDNYNELEAILDEAIKNDFIDEISKRKKKLAKTVNSQNVDLETEKTHFETQLTETFCFQNSFYTNFESIADKIIENQNKYLSKLQKIEYILIYEAPPFKNIAANSYLENNYFLTSDKGNYASSIKSCFESDETTNCCKQILINNNTAYFDLFMAGMPIGNVQVNNKSLRECWCTNQYWLIGGKALPVVLFELGIFHLLKQKKDEIIKFPKIAIGAPIKTSVSIFEFYHEKPLKIFVKETTNELTLADVIFTPGSNVSDDFEEKISIDVSQANTPSTFNNIGSKGILLPLHKSNIVSSANSPHGVLMKNAFDKLTTHNSV
jgi:hypothetical protein